MAKRKSNKLLSFEEAAFKRIDEEIFSRFQRILEEQRAYDHFNSHQQQGESGEENTNVSNVDAVSSSDCGGETN